MSLQSDSIDDVKQPLSLDAFLSIGFRPFFFGASIFAVLSMCTWMFTYFQHIQLSTAPLSIFQWHAHEMIFGYAMAIIAGFLLTAVANWTGLPTSTGKPLLLMFSFWCAARVLYFFGTQFIMLAAILDIAFSLLLLVSIVIPIIEKKLWLRMAVITKIVLIVTFHCLFLLGVGGILEQGVHLGIYGALYLIIGLILTIGKNLIPFFIERGVGYDVSISSFRFLDISSLVLFLLFFIFELGSFSPTFSGYCAIALFIVNALRLAQWHTPGIWQKPLLWGLYLSYFFICLGFLLFALHYFTGASKYLAIHAFAMGAIGLITLSMICRVATGHTGRSIAQPPALVKFALLSLIIGAISRVVLPLIWPTYYSLWIGISMSLWLLAFCLYLVSFSYILLSPRLPE